MNTIGQHLRNIRQEKQISQEELAEKVFTTRQTISNYETGKSSPDLAMIEALAKALEVDSEAILYGDGKDEQKRHAWTLWIGALILIVLILILASASMEWIPAADDFKRILVYCFWKTVLLCPAVFLLGWSTAGVVLLYVPPEERLFRQNRRIMVGTVLITGLFAAAALLTVLSATGTPLAGPRYGVLGKGIFSLVYTVAHRFWTNILFVLLGAAGCVCARGKDA